MKKYKIEEVKKTYHTIKNSWTMNHKHVVFTLSLCVALLWQTFGDMVPHVQLVNEIVAYNVESVESSHIVGDCDIECLTREWVELRTEQIMQEDMDTYRSMSRYKALQESNENINKILLDVRAVAE